MLATTLYPLESISPSATVTPTTLVPADTRMSYSDIATIVGSSSGSIVSFLTLVVGFIHRNKLRCGGRSIRIVDDKGGDDDENDEKKSKKGRDEEEEEEDDTKTKKRRDEEEDSEDSDDSKKTTKKRSQAKKNDDDVVSPNTHVSEDTAAIAIAAITKIATASAAAHASA